MTRKSIAIIVCLVILSMVTTSLFACNDSKADEGGLSVSYDIRCSIDDKAKCMFVTTIVSITNDSRIMLKELPFYLYANAYEDEGGDVTIGNVSSCARNLIYNIDNTNMAVTLLEELGEGESTDITISSRVSIPKGNGWFGYGENYYNLHAFFPRLAYFDGSNFVVVPYSKIGDPYCFSEDDMVIKLEYSKDYVLAYSGEEVSLEEKDAYKESTISISNARDVAFSLVREYSVYENEANGIKIYQYSKEDKDYTPFIKQCLEYFSREIGAYPYSTLTMVESPFEYGGMEYSSLILVNESAKNKEYVIAHEIIHQWFGLSVGSNSYKECWVDESLTNYLTYCYLDWLSNGFYEKTIESEKMAYKELLEIGKEKYGAGYSPKINVSLGEFRSMGEYAQMVYGYGVLMFDGVKNVIGDKKFHKAVKEYYGQYKSKVASGENLISCFGKIAGKRVDGIFNSYMENKVMF